MSSRITGENFVEWIGREVFRFPLVGVTRILYINVIVLSNERELGFRIL